MTDRSTIEFYLAPEAPGSRPRMLASFVTEAPPPPAGALINIRQTDYKVIDVDYSLDQPSYGPRTYRRNVILEKAAAGD